MGLTSILLQTRQGYERAVLRYRHRVFGYAFHMLGDLEDSADVAQEVFVKLWERRNEVEGSRLLPWLMSVTRNACIDVLRHRRTKHAVVRMSDAVAETVAGDVELPDATSERRELRRQIESALSRLSEPYRSIVILREIQDLSYADICRVLDLPLTTVKVYLHRGRRALRSAISEVTERETAG